MPKYRVTITEVLTHSGVVEVEAESKVQAEERVLAEGGYAFDDLSTRTGDVFLEIETIH
jgi:hypothetical protein